MAEDRYAPEVESEEPGTKGDNYGSRYSLTDKQDAVRDAVRRMDPVHQHWRVLESLYRTGAQRELSAADVSRIMPYPVPGTFLRTVNMVLPHLTLLINSVVARDPKLIVTPVGGDVADIELHGQVAQAVLEYFWKRTAATEVLRDVTQDMVVLGNGFAKVGWAYSEQTRDFTSDDQDVLVAAAAEVLGEMGVDVDDSIMSELVESVSLTESLVEVDEPYVEYVSPYDVFVPANARRINQARWIAQRLRLPLEELRANPLFNQEVVEGLAPDTGFADPDTLQRYEEREEGLPSIFEHTTVYEFYDMRDRTLCVFSLDAEEALFEGPIPYAHRYPPFVHMRNFNDGGNSFWSFGDVENVAGLQLMTNEIMLAELSDLKRVGNKYFINRQVLTPEISKALASNQPDQVIPVDLPANLSINEVLQPVQRLATPSDNFVMEQRLQEYMQRVLGVTDLQLGSMVSASRVPATAAAAVEGASTVRALDKTVNVESACREVGTRILGLCQQFLDTGKAIRIAGPNAPMWLEVTAEDISGEFAIETEGGSTQAINPLTRARQGVELLQGVVPMLAQLGYDPENTIRTALRYMGLDPDHLLVRPEPQAAPAGPEGLAGDVPPGGGEPSPEDILGLLGGGPEVPPGGQYDIGAGGPDMMGSLGDMGAPPVDEGGGIIY
jgi:hypothetical protein